MKEKIVNIAKAVQSRYSQQSRLLKITVPMLAALSLVAAGMFTFSFTEKNEVANAATAKTEAQPVAIQQDLAVGTVGASDLSMSGNAEPNNSWPGVIISSALSQIQPQREGVITEWRVRIGDVVSAGDVLGKISAPPATPELIAMLTEKKEALAMSEAGANIADEYTAKEKARLEELGKSIAVSADGKNDATATTISRMRERVASKAAALRSSIEKAVAAHVLKTTQYMDWRQIGSGGTLPDQSYGALSTQVQIDYEWALALLASELKKSPNPPIEAAKKYFALAIELTDKSFILPGSEVGEFRTMVAEDKKDFLEALADYQEALADVADKETEYALMIGEKKAMLEKDRLMAHAEARAKETSYETMANQVQGGSYIVAPRAGTVSAIYKNVGDLVDPAMKIATVAGGDRKNLLVRMQIPNNIPKPSIGAILSVVRPGFSADKREAAITGVGAVLDESGSYMADAVLTKDADWSAGASVRVIPPASLSTPLINFSAVWWSQSGIPHIWGVSDAGRIFPIKVAIGRTIGNSVEIYEGIKNGDKYVLAASPDIREDMLISDLPSNTGDANASTQPSEKKPMGGMEM